MIFKEEKNLIDSKEMLEEYIDKILSKDGYSTDDYIKINSKGKYFEKNLITSFSVYGENDKNQLSYLKPLSNRDSYKHEIINTINYIQNNFDDIYENMLKALLDVNIENIYTGEQVTDIKGLNQARYIDKNEISHCISNIQLNCQKVIDGFMYYSFIFNIDFTKYGFDDGFEVVFYKDKVVFFGDGNSGEYILDFSDYLVV